LISETQPVLAEKETPAEKKEITSSSWLAVWGLGLPIVSLVAASFGKYTMALLVLFCWLFSLVGSFLYVLTPFFLIFDFLINVVKTNQKAQLEREEQKKKKKKKCC
jgi:hypothetical protein